MKNLIAIVTLLMTIIATPPAHASEAIYVNEDTIPLSFSRVRAGTIVSGLTVTVVVKNAATGATLLSSHSVPEVLAGSGIYSYSWAHGLSADTECLVTFTVGSQIYSEHLFITINTGSRAT